MATTKDQAKPQPKATAIATRKPNLPANFPGLVAVRQAVEELEAFMKFGLLQQGIDYGIIPGTNKPMLFKPGLEQLANYYHLVIDQEVDENGTDFERGIFRYRVITHGYEVDPKTGVKIPRGQGRGSCSSLESKYRWRWLKYYELPSEVPRNDEGKVDTKKAVEYWKAKYGEQAVKYQSFGKDKGGQWLFRIENPDPHDLENTILKQGCTRSLRAFVLLATGADRCFFSEKDAEKMGLKRNLDDDDFTEKGEVIEGEFKEVPENGNGKVETPAATKTEPAATKTEPATKKTEPAVETKTQAKVKETADDMPWDKFIKTVQDCCIKLGWAKGKLGWSANGNELGKLLESYPKVTEIRQLSEAGREFQRHDLVSRLFDLIAAAEENVQKAAATEPAKTQEQMKL